MIKIIRFCYNSDFGFYYMIYIYVFALLTLFLDFISDSINFFLLVFLCLLLFIIIIPIFCYRFYLKVRKLDLDNELDM